MGNFPPAMASFLRATNYHQMVMGYHPMETGYHPMATGFQRPFIFMPPGHASYFTGVRGHAMIAITTTPYAPTMTFINMPITTSMSGTSKY